ncbi:MAG: TRAP transporter substrate-binding protein DctP [Pseudomonadota bacterium]
MIRVLNIIGVFVLCGFLSPGVHAKTLKFATLAPAGTTWMKEMKAGAKQVKKRTEGRVKIKFYPGGVMGNDQSVHRKIKIGQLHGGAFTPGGLSHVYPSIQAYGLPMLFNTLEEVDYVRGKVEPLIKQGVEEEGFVVLGISEGGFVRILSKYPMQDLETIRQSKVWIPEGDRLSQITFKALGISPVALPISDVFTGLQTGLIETVAVNPTSALAFQWHTSTGYMTDIPISYVIGVLAIQKKAFDKLKAEDQAIVREEMGKVFKRLDSKNRQDNQQAVEVLKKQGIQFVMPNPGERDRWKSISDKAVEEMTASGFIDSKVAGEVQQHLRTLRSSQ